MVYFVFLILFFCSNSFCQPDHVLPEDNVIDNYCANTTINFMMIWTTGADTWKPRYQRTMESILYHHPSACMRFYTDGVTSSHPTIHALNMAGYRVITIPLKDSIKKLFQNTPIETWWNRKREWENGKYFYSHQTNAIRFNLLWRYGGVYIDGDVIILKSMHHLRNAVGVQMSQLEDQILDKGPKFADMLNNAVMVFDKGHPALWEMMKEFNKTYNKNKWSYNGAKLVTRVVHRLNKVGGIDERVVILPRSAFYPLLWTQNKDQGAVYWFDGKTHALEKHQQKWQQIKSQGYSLHWHNHNTKGKVAVKNSLMWMAFNEFCILCRRKVN